MPPTARLLCPACACLCPPALLCPPSASSALIALVVDPTDLQPTRFLVPAGTSSHRPGSIVMAPAVRVATPLPLPSAPTPHVPRPTPTALSLYLLPSTPSTPPSTSPSTSPSLAGHHQPTCNSITLHPHSADTITTRCSPVLPVRHDSSAQSSLGHAGCATSVQRRTK
jgi:hypothetical protein